MLLSFCSLLRRLQATEQPCGGCDDRGAGHGAGPVLLHLHLHHRGARGHGRPRQDRQPHDPGGQHWHQRHQHHRQLHSDRGQVGPTIL